MINSNFLPTILPNGELSNVIPYHVCTKGPEDRVIFWDEEDLRVAHNFIPICARRANVAVLSCCVLNSHLHNVILAKSFSDAVNFINSYKVSLGLYLKHRHQDSTGVFFRKVESKPIPIGDIPYLRNAICYVARNALDAGFTIDSYRWSSYRAYFKNGKSIYSTKRLSDTPYRIARSLLKTTDTFHNVPWEITDDGIIEPVSYCDWRYVERLFGNSNSFFLKVLGFTDDVQMEHSLVQLPSTMIETNKFIKEINLKANKRYGIPLSDLTFNQKVPLVRSSYFSFCTTTAQLARCFNLTKEEVKLILAHPK